MLETWTRAWLASVLWRGNIYKYFVILVVLLKFMLLRKGNSKVCEKLLVLQFYKYLKSASSLTAVQEINYIPSGN